MNPTKPANMPLSHAGQKTYAYGAERETREGTLFQVQRQVWTRASL